MAFTPSRRGPALPDAAGGTSERPVARTQDPVMRVVGAVTKEIRLTPTGTDADAGEGASYVLGQAGAGAVGRYRVSRQGAASATAKPLGAVTWMEFEVREDTAGVYKVDWASQYDGLVAIEDTVSNVGHGALDATLLGDADTLDFSASASADSALAVIILTSTQATDLLAAGVADGTVGVEGDLIMYDTSSAATKVYTVTRVTDAS